MAGSLEKRGKNSWRLEVNAGVDANGKYIRKRKTVTARNKSEAKELLQEFSVQVRKGQYIAPSEIKFANFVESWRNQAKKELAPKTMEMYNYLLDGRVIPHFGHYKMENIITMNINEYIDGLEKEGLSSSTRQKHLNVLSNIFKMAYKNKLIEINPVEEANSVIVRYKSGEVYDDEELKHVLHLLNEENNFQMALLVKLAFNTGMRKGEILALQVDDLDFANNIIHIRHSLSYTKENGYQLKQPKTKNSVRSIGVSSKMMKELKRQVYVKRTNKADAAELWQGNENQYVFSSDLGKPIHQNVPSKWWSRFQKRHNLKKIRFHDIRHTFATGLMNKGTNINKLSKYLGHNSISVSMDIYGHLIKSDREIADTQDEHYI